EEAFTAEMAITLESIAAAGIKTDSLFVGFREGKLIARPNEAHGYKPLRRHSPAGQIMRPYTVRMHFAELDDVKPGTRVFDIRLQGKTVETGFDVAREGLGLKAIRREFKGIRCGKDLKIEFVSKSAEMSDESAPILSGLEVIAE
ncbi:MAG: malectin domain-containing carbohydrate-binding protein, partial [Planctomycetota bacterium]|nr:malectin domain-containing carbohydrate-binding protein [Planctomycetota bacterium]